MSSLHVKEILIIIFVNNSIAVTNTKDTKSPKLSISATNWFRPQDNLPLFSNEIIRTRIFVTLIMEQKLTPIKYSLCSAWYGY